jgi:hypothetical protein
VTAPRNVNRCTECLEGNHRRCTGSAGNIGCGCIHAAPVPVPLEAGGDLDVEVVEPDRAVPVLDPAVVRERLAELERDREVQQRVVAALDRLLDDERHALSWLDHQLSDMRAHPAVVAALARADSVTSRDPGDVLAERRATEGLS